VLEPNKTAVVKRYEQTKAGEVRSTSPILGKVARNVADLDFHNHSNLAKALRLAIHCSGEMW
jgi:hypothetical protein